MSVNLWYTLVQFKKKEKRDDDNDDDAAGAESKS